MSFPKTVDLPVKLALGLNEDNRDVADVWKDALKKYTDIVGLELQPKFGNVEDMIQFGTQEMNNFHSFRHNNKKVDKLRTLFSSNINYLQVGMQQLVAAATPAFPPAATIGTALTYILTVCSQTSADYDTVVVFFDDMNSFLARIVILETRMPPLQAYRNCLMDVFTSFLTVCAYAHKYIELGRFKKWIANLVAGQDSDLGDARKQMDSNLARLQNATEFAILGNTEELKRMNGDLKANQDSHTEMLEAHKHAMEAIHDDTESIRRDMAKLLIAFQQQSSKQSEKPPEQGANKPTSAIAIRNCMLTVPGDMHQYRILKETMVKDTCQWVFARPEWKAWMKQDSVSRPVLAIVGEPGVGKSHIAAAVYDKLHELAMADTTLHTCAAHFYFRQRQTSLRIFLAAVITTINQVAEGNALVCEIINRERVRDEVMFDLDSWQDLTRMLLAPAFNEESGNHLVIVLDGLDELRLPHPVEEFVKCIKELKLNISIIVTSRVELMQEITFNNDVVKIPVTKESQLQDIKALVRIRIEDLGQLRKFRQSIKQRIAQKVEEVSPNVLYAEHLLLRLNSIGREQGTIRALSQKLPQDLNGLYSSMLDECRRRLPPARQEVASQLLLWVAYGNNQLTLNGMESLLRYFSHDASFSSEEIGEVVSRFLNIGDPAMDAEARNPGAAVGSGKSMESVKKSLEVDDEDDETLDDGTLPVTFKERSMEAYFKDAQITEDTVWILRPSESHRRLLLICLDMLQPELAKHLDSTLWKYTSSLLKHFVSIEPEKHTSMELAEVMERLGSMFAVGTSFAKSSKDAGVVYRKANTSKANGKIKEWSKLLDKPEIKDELSQEVIAWWEEVAVDPRRTRLGMAKAYLRWLYDQDDLDEAMGFFTLLYGVLSVSDLESMLGKQAAQNFPEEYAEGKSKALAESRKSQTEDRKVKDVADAEAVKANGNPIDERSKIERAPGQGTGNSDIPSKGLAALGILGLFDDIDTGITAYRAVAGILFRYKHHGPAYQVCQKAAKLCNPSDIAEKFKILQLRAAIELKLRQPQQAHQTILECLDQVNCDQIPPAVKRLALTTRASIEAKLKHSSATARSYALAREVDPNGLTSGEALLQELRVFERNADYEGYISTIKGWNTIERLTWMAWEYHDNGQRRHRELRRIARITNQGEFICEAYEDCFKFLDKLNAGAPLRLEQAIAYSEVLGDFAAARAALDVVFDSTSNGWRYGVTNEPPQYTLGRAMDTMSDVLYELFVASHDPVVKEEIYEALQGLTKRPLALAVPLFTNLMLFQCRIIITSMCRKMGNAREFQRRLQRLMDACFDGTRDKVSWNDQVYLDKLAHCLAVLSQAVPEAKDLVWYARVVMSAVFSKFTTTEEEDNKEGEGSEDGGDKEGGQKGADAASSDAGSDAESDGGREFVHIYDQPDFELPKDQGDLCPPRDALCDCDGVVCHPISEWVYWPDSPTYYCMTCSNAIICSICYEAGMTDDEKGPGSKLVRCGRNHMFTTLPVEGWRGIENGMLKIEGRETVSFEDFLRDLQNNVCKQAWALFWAGI